MDDLTYLAEVCFFPECASDHPAAMQRYIGCAGLVQGSFSEEDACKTVIEIRAMLVAWVQDEWVRRRTMDHDRRMIVVPTSSLVLLTNNYLPRLGHEATGSGDAAESNGIGKGYQPQRGPGQSASSSGQPPRGAGQSFLEFKTSMPNWNWLWPRLPHRMRRSGNH